MKNDTLSIHVLGTRLDHGSEPCVEWIREANMADDTAFKKGEGPHTLGPVDDLVWNDEVHGLNLFLQGTNSRQGNHTPHANVSEGSNVGSIGNFVRGELVMHAVPSEKSDVDAVVREDADG